MQGGLRHLGCKTSAWNETVLNILDSWNVLMKTAHDFITFVFIFCAILPPLTQICFAFFLVVCRGLWKAVWWVVLGVHVGVHGEWVMLWVGAMYNVLAILSMADVVSLACMHKLLQIESMHEQCWVCMVCVVYGLYIVCLSYVIAAEHGRYGSME